jgi:ATP-dependent Lhr-like helicase
MPSQNSIPAQFHPVIARWFDDNIGHPTDAQNQAWPEIIAGKHVLITAPTGSGKTLAAFMWAIDKLVTGKFETGHTTILYVSPLKALNNDIQRNLLTPLGELKDCFQKKGESFPDIQVLTRSGDTSPSARRRMLRRPPEILITTPESLNLLLSSQGGRSMLTHLATVILDEIHAVIGNKRGVHLITAVDRLVPLSGEFQRIALSATIRPLEDVAHFVGGYKIDGDMNTPRYALRPVSVVQSHAAKTYELRIGYSRQPPGQQAPDSIWKPLVEDCKRIIQTHRSTLIFVNSRRLCEKLTLKINQDADRPLAYAHHGSLSRTIRTEVERKFKAGDLKAIVATHSLELGIDIGSLEGVILVQSPFSISSAIQRVGRAGHQVGTVSRGYLMPTHERDILESAVLVSSIPRQDIEAVKPILGPMDVLAQIIVSMVSVEMWHIDALYVHLKTSYPYRHLDRKQFDLVLNMLNGRYADSRIRELKPRVSIDRLDNTVVARKGARLALFISGGTIPDRGYFNLRHLDTNARIGDLDEEFVWEARVGQIFALGTQNWQIQRITHNDVFVTPAAPKAASAPFWKGEQNGRDFHFSEGIGLFLEEVNRHLDQPGYASELQRIYSMDSNAAENLIAFLKKQIKKTGCDLPHRHHLLIEFSSRGPGFTPANQVVLHTIWGGKINRPFAMALDAAWEAEFGQRIEIFAGNDCLVLFTPHDVTGHKLLSMVNSATVESLLQKRLEGSGFFGARFRECAGRSLCLTRAQFNERLPLWMSRVKSQKLLEAVQKYGDFPILLEAWRSCLQDEFDMENLCRLLDEIESGTIQTTEVKTAHPSPMAQSAAWSQINHYMYMDDTPAGGQVTTLRKDLLNELVFSPGLRPPLSTEIVKRFELKRQRLHPGYAPHSSQDLLDWVKERLLIPFSEWEKLLQAVQTDHGIDPRQLLKPIAEKLVMLNPSGASASLVASLEYMPQLAHVFYDCEPELQITRISGTHVARSGLRYELSREDLDVEYMALLGQWLEFYGPLGIDAIASILGVEPDRLQQGLNDLIESNTMICGQLIDRVQKDLYCDSENFEILLRISRIAAVPDVKPLEIKWLPLFLARIQGLTQNRKAIDGLFQCLEQLLCYPLKAELWESEVFPSRLSPYEPAWLDSIAQEGEVIWIGRDKQKIAFCLKPELELLNAESKTPHPEESAFFDSATLQTRSNRSPKKTADLHRLRELFDDETARYDFSALLHKTNLNTRDLVTQLWEAVWRGYITNDSFLALRRGIENRFDIPNVTESSSRRRNRLHHRVHRAGFTRWKSLLPFGGNWYRIGRGWADDDDLLEKEERKKDRVRLLLDRYGLLFRELLDRELPEFRWSAIFRTLRLMELSGEILTGYFFKDLPGPQFISRYALRVFQQALPTKTVYWINATDPVSLCGIQIGALKTGLPKRLAGTHLVYCGRKLVLVSRRYGKFLEFQAPVDDPRIQEYLCSLRHLLTRTFQPFRHITIETINSVAAARSEYVEILKTSFDVMVSYRQVVLYKKIKS